MSFLTKLKSVISLVLVSLNLKALPVVDGKLDLSEDQLKKLKTDLGEERVTQMITAIDAELSAYHSEQAKNDELLLAADNELQKILASSHGARSDTSGEEDPGNQEELSLLGKISALGKNVDDINAKNVELERKVAALIKMPEIDNPLLNDKGVRELIKHSATHLFATNKNYDLLTRNWNARVLNAGLSATDFTDSTNIALLNSDLKMYYRENPDEIKSLERDLFDLPSFIKKRIKVSDEVASATVVSAEITQARKLSFLPKNEHHIEGEIGKVYPIQIDIQYIGFYLQRIENSYINFMNQEGSQPYKMRFVAFLVNELRKKQRVEDRMATINGVYVKPPLDIKVPGKFLNRQNGLMYLLWQARDVIKKYRAFTNLGTPTPTNVVDYVDKFLDSLPPEVKVMPGLVFNWSPSWHKKYKERYKELNAQNLDYQEITTHPAGYSNIEFCTWVDMEGSDFMYLTFKDNYTLLEMIPAERGMYHFETLKRIIYIWADYKLGIMLDHIGNHKIKPNAPEAFKVQSVWSNMMPIFSKRYQAYLYDDKSGEIEAIHNFITVNPDWVTNITKIKPLHIGQVLKITGSKELENAKYIKKSSDLDLTADFDLSNGGTLTLVSQDKEGKWKELSRTSEPEMLPNSIDFTDVIDTSAASVFKFNGVDDTEVSAITPGVENQIITIQGGDSVVTIPASLANVKIDAAVQLADASATVQFIYVDGIWHKL